MEPRMPAPNRGPELPQANYGQNSERVPTSSAPETAMEHYEERIERRSEMPSATSAGATILPAPVMPTVPTPASSVTPVSVVDDTPTVANDDDLIEKEWVEKAKKIIVRTKDDPYLREQEVGKLQADYLRKRYGRELGAPQ